VEIILSLSYTALFVILIYKINFFEVDGLSRKALSALFILKIIFGLAVWFVYTFYYTDRLANDVFKFFDDGAIMFSAIYQHPMHYLQMILGIDTNAPYLEPYYKKMANWYKPWAAATYHNNRIIIQFNAIVHLFSFGYYNVHTVFMSFLSFVGLTGIYKIFIPLLKDKKRELAIAVFLIPSALFWGSGVLKEGITLFSLGMMLFFFYQYVFIQKTLKYLVWIIFTAMILAFTKIYVFVAIFPSLVALVLIKKLNIKSMFIVFLLIHLLFFFISVNLFQLNPEWDILKALSHKQWSLTTIAEQENAGSLITTKVLESTTISFIKNAPEAIINTLFRPTIFESKTLFMFVSGLENLFFVIVVLISLFFFKIPEKKALPLFFTSIFFVITLALLIGIVNPVLGSIVRFRIPLLPFFAIIFIVLIDKQKLLIKLPFLQTVLK
jgi:hypothetical protein